jgi:integrase
VKGNKEDAREVNKHIDSLVLKVNKIHSTLSDRNEIVSASKIKQIFCGTNLRNKSLMESFSLHNEMVSARVGIDFSKSTFKRYLTTYDHVRQFLKHQYDRCDILLTDLKYSFLTDLEHFFKVVRQCNHNSSQKYIRNFRKIINMAVKNGWLEKDPFLKYRVKLKETKRVFLTIEELLKLQEKELPVKRLEQVRDVFVFCCYTGLSYVDVEKLSPTQILKGYDGELWVNVDRTKTGSPSNVPLLPQAIKIVDGYKHVQRL